jgi:hypothetical protein
VSPLNKCIYEDWIQIHVTGSEEVRQACVRHFGTNQSADGSLKLRDISPMAGKGKNILQSYKDK